MICMFLHLRPKSTGSLKVIHSGILTICYILSFLFLFVFTGPTRPRVLLLYYYSTNSAICRPSDRPYYSCQSGRDNGFAITLSCSSNETSDSVSPGPVFGCVGLFPLTPLFLVAAPWPPVCVFNASEGGGGLVRTIRCGSIVDLYAAALMGWTRTTDVLELDTVVRVQRFFTRRQRFYTKVAII